VKKGKDEDMNLGQILLAGILWVSVITNYLILDVESNRLFRSGVD
jgi:hypothetical protein